MKAWNELNKETQGWMVELGHFEPTVRVDQRCVKGYTDGGKTYYDSNDLRQLSKACLEVANWLDERANEKEEEPDEPCSFCFSTNCNGICISGLDN